MANRSIRIGTLCWWLRGILATVTVHVILVLGLRIIRLEIVIGNRPSRRNAAGVQGLVEIFPPQTKQRSSEELRVAAYVIMRVRMQLGAMPIAPDFLGLILGVEIHRGRVPVILFAWNVIPAFEHQDLFPRRRELRGESSTARAGSDDDHVIMAHDRFP